MPSGVRITQQELRKELSVDPDFGEAYLYLGAAIRRSGDDQSAIPLLEEALARQPDLLLAYSELATAQMQTGHRERGLDVLREGETRFPDEPSIAAQTAKLLMQMGRKDDASKEAQHARLLLAKANSVSSAPQ